VGTEQAREHAQQGRLAGPVAAQHRKRLPGLDARGDAGERDPLAVPPLEAVELDRRHAGGKPMALRPGRCPSTNLTFVPYYGVNGRLVARGAGG
jgi:hypothetical protein